MRGIPSEFLCFLQGLSVFVGKPRRDLVLGKVKRATRPPLAGFRAKRRCTVVALLQHLANFGATTVAVGHPVDGL